MRPLTGILLAILVASLAASWFFSTFERVTQPEWRGYSGEAIFNDYFAAEQFLREAGVESDSLPTWTNNGDLTATEDTVVTRISPELASKSQGDFVLGWIGNGGHLVLLPALEVNADTERFLENLGFRLTPVADEENDEAAQAGEDDDRAEAENYDYTVALEQTRLRVETGADVPVSASLADDRGMIAVRREWGEGVITVFADARYFSNDQLNSFDHARLLLDAVAGYFTPGKVWFIYDAAFPSLWTLLRETFPLLVACTGLALLAWIWSVMPGFGPKMTALAETRRSILEHVQAAGLFTWRHRGAAELVRSTASATLRAAEIHHPGIGLLSREEQARRLSKLTGLAPDSIAAALAGDNVGRSREFAECIHLLQQVKERL